ncbi:MAG: phosphatase PAP2 family protein [Chloroflexi bacterium]|nr:phosphatase PAP2 family protein [Chloroflexota bacterium]
MATMAGAAMIAGDVALLHAINGLAGRLPWLDRLAELLVNEYFVPAALGLCLLGLWFSGTTTAERRQRQWLVLAAVAALIVANGIVALSNHFYYRPRPFTVEELTLLFYRPSDSSFPSNPAALAFSVALPVWVASRQVGALACTLAILYSFVRIYVGVHYPSDVLGGALVGLGSAWLVLWARGLLQPIFSPIIRLVAWAGLA